MKPSPPQLVPQDKPLASPPICEEHDPLYPQTNSPITNHKDIDRKKFSSCCKWCKYHKHKTHNLDECLFQWKN